MDCMLKAQTSFFYKNISYMTKILILNIVHDFLLPDIFF